MDSVSGDLKRYPVARLLFHLCSKRFSGTLRINDVAESSTTAVFFNEGLPSRVDRSSLDDVLCRVLVERGIISEDICNRSLELFSAGGMLHGQVLRDMGAIDDRCLIAALNLQLRRKLNRLFYCRDARFEIDPTPHTYGDDSEGKLVRADPLWAIYDGVHNAFDAKRLAAQLAPLANSRLQLRTLPQEILARYHMSSQEQALLPRLQRQPIAIPAISDMGGISPLEAQMLIYTLWVTEALRIVEGAKATPQMGIPCDSPPQSAAFIAPTIVPPPLVADISAVDVNPMPEGVDSDPGRNSSSGGSTSWGEISDSSTGEEPFKVPAETPQAAPPVTAPPITASRQRLTPSSPAEAVGAALARNQPTTDQAQLIARIEEKWEGIQEKNLFEILGIPLGESSKGVTNAYFNMAKHFHPDRFSGLGRPDLLSKADDIFRKINEANTVLSDPDARREYECKLRGAQSAESTGRDAIEAEISFQKGMLAFRRKKFSEALEHFNEAWKLNSDEGEHLAWIAWTQYRDPKRGDILPASIKDSLVRATEISPNRADPQYFLGEVLLEKGQRSAAIRAFQRALEVKEDHIDALRRLRIMKMRSDSQSATGKHRAAGRKSSAGRRSSGRNSTVGEKSNTKSSSSLWQRLRNKSSS